MIDANTINLLTYKAQVKRRRIAYGLSSARLEQIASIALLNRKLGRKCTLAELRRELCLGHSSMLPHLDNSELVSVGRLPVHNGMTRDYKLTPEGEMTLTRIINPTATK